MVNYDRIWLAGLIFVITSWLSIITYCIYSDINAKDYTINTKGVEKHELITKNT